MARKKRLQLLLSDLEYQNLKEYAETKQIPMSEVLRDYIKTLAHPEGCRNTSHD